MILVSAPLRVSFFGGGSDLESYYKNHGGAFLSLTLNSRIFLAVNLTTNNEVKVHYSKTEIVESSSMLEHSLIREALNLFKIDNNIEIGSFADMPTSGTGLGSSSSFSVALIGALKKIKGIPFSSRDLAEEACHLEIDICGENIGKQDQYANSIASELINDLQQATKYPPDTIDRISADELIGVVNELCHSIEKARQGVDTGDGGLFDDL